MKYSILFTLLLLCACRADQDAKMIDPGLTKFVDTRFGTDGLGGVSPGAKVPFGAIQPSPNNGTRANEISAGYHYNDSIIAGFSHLSAMYDWGDLLISPVNNALDMSAKIDNNRSAAYASTFSHANEIATPGLYRVQLDNGIVVDLTATSTVALHAYQFPISGQRQILIDLGMDDQISRFQKSTIRQESPTVYTGFQLAHAENNAPIYFAIEFSESPNKLQLLDGTAKVEGSEVSGRDLRGLWSFEQSRESLMIKVGFSSESSTAAKKALAEIPAWHFQRVHNNALMLWRNELQKIEVTTDDSDLIRTFYSALYRTCLAPTISFGDVGPDDAPGGTKTIDEALLRYKGFTLSNTFRALHPLYTITQVDRVNDMVRSLLDYFDAFGTFPSRGDNEGSYFAIPVIVDAYMKGMREFNGERAYAAMRQVLRLNRSDKEGYNTLGYVASEHVKEPVRRTLEYAYSDWCLAQMAFVLNKMDDYRLLMDRCANYANLFDKSIVRMRPRSKDGHWVVDSDSAEVSNPFHNAWFVPHDMRALIALHGTNVNFTEHLDSFFDQDLDSNPLVHSAGHHLAYLDNYAGAAWKTQGRLRTLLGAFSDQPNGLPGFDGDGQLSAWFVFSSMGFYPVNPAEGVYAIGSPLFTKVIINVGDGASFILRGRFVTDENIYIQEATLEEEPLTRSYIRHFEIAEGGELILVMGPLPNYLHWSDPESAPPSMSDLDLE